MNNITFSYLFNLIGDKCRCSWASSEVRLQVRESCLGTISSTVSWRRRGVHSYTTDWTGVRYAKHVISLLCPQCLRLVWVVARFTIESNSLASSLSWYQLTVWSYKHHSLDHWLPQTTNRRHSGESPLDYRYHVGMYFSSFQVTNVYI